MDCENKGCGIDVSQQSALVSEGANNREWTRGSKLREHHATILKSL
jgi:hypothetical protein